MADWKVFCKYKLETTKLLCYLRKTYGDKIVVHHGGKGDYLGMDLNFTQKGVLQVDMIKYIREVIEERSEEISKGSPTPDNENIYEMRDNKA